MQKNIAELAEIMLVGVTTRASNSRMFESDPQVNKIAAVVKKYFHNELAQQIPGRKNPGTTYCVYTDYENDVNGNFTYFIGEQVTSFDNVDEEFEILTIPAQNYTKFTNQPGPMPAVCIDMWQNIWKMSESDLGGKRAYVADLEVYDSRKSHDHNNVTLDIYIGIRK